VGGALPGGPAPDPSTQSKLAELSAATPLAAGTATIFRNKNVKAGGIIPPGYLSHVEECSTAVGGKYAWFTGNWFAARSVNGGSTWAYVNPFADMSDFCCDQVTIYDESRNRIYWLRQGIPGTNPVNGNYENRFRLGVSSDGGATFCYYNNYPTEVNSTWTNQWWDYPHIQLGADFLYITYNVFNSGNAWVRTVILRWPLDSLASCSGFSYNYSTSSSWFTFVPAQGTEHTVYYASNWPTTAPQNTRLNIWKWDEDSTSISSVTKTVTAWDFTNRGSATCGSASGNWAARFDQRLLAGARYMIEGTDVKYPGRKVLGWWWNVKQGNVFPNPYIEAAAFFENGFAQVSGNQGRPLVWNSTTCFSYPSAAANRREDVGLVFNYSSGDNKYPSVAFALGDDYAPAPAGWSYYNVQTSTARPSDNKWGDYNTARTYRPSADIWAGAAHILTSASGDGTPYFFEFGRGRDTASWNRWQDK
jgi:hypothetical protein